MDEDEDIGGLAGTGSQLAYEKGIQQNMDVLQSARAALRAKRVGPSDAEKWFAIASALGQPTRTGSFGETVGNLGTLLAKYSGEKREAEEGREVKLADLDARARTEQLRLLAARATADARAAAANAPKYDPLSSGGYQQRPGTGGAPQMPQRDSYGNYIITDMRQLTFLPVNTPVIEPGQDPTKPKYVSPPTPR